MTRTSAYSEGFDRTLERLNGGSTAQPWHKTRVYISGPMSGLPDYNYPAFDAAAVKLLTLGYRPINPAEGITDTSKPWEWYMRRALRLLLGADEIWMLPGWEDSRGAQLELAVVESLSMPVKLDMFEVEGDH